MLFIYLLGTKNAFFIFAFSAIRASLMRQKNFRIWKNIFENIIKNRAGSPKYTKRILRAYHYF